MSKGKILMSYHHRNTLFPADWKLQQMELLCYAFEKIRYWQYPESWFRHWRFYWNATPGAWIISNGRKIELTPQKIVLIPSFTPYSTGMSQPFEHFFIHFYSTGALDKIRREILVFDADSMTEKVPELMQKSGIPQMLGVYALLFNALAQIPDESYLPNSGEVIDPRIRRILNLMYEHISTPVDNRHFSRIAGMGINDFYELFKKEMNLTPRQYMVMLRMDHAGNLLRHSQLTIEEIAEKCGYADRFHFSKAFRNCYGIPPAEFRRKHE